MQNYLQPFQGFRPQMNGYKVIPVSSEIEMNNITVDFNGTPTYFHNQNLNEIYVKQFDIKTGLTTTQKFVKPEHVQHENLESKSDLDISLFKEKLEALNERLNSLEEKLDKGGKK